MRNYQELLQDILDNGDHVSDRTGVGTHSVFGRMLKFDLSKGFPATTCKGLVWRSVVGELLWFLSGSCDRRYLQELTTGKFSEDSFDIWKGNAESPHNNGDYFNGYNIGNMYPVYWRRLPVPVPYGMTKIPVKTFVNTPYSLFSDFFRPR